MSRISDEELIEELKTRFKETKEVLSEQAKLMEELKAVNNRLEESEKVKGHFLSNIKNEINNPLASILALTRNMLNIKQMDEKRIKNSSELIYKEAFSLDFQLRNIFAAAEIEAGDIAMHFTKSDIHQIIRSVIDSFDHRIKKQNIKIDFLSLVSTDQPCYFVTDPEKLQLVISNLISNGLEFNKQDETLTIRLDVSDDQLTLSFTDNGEGIAEQDFDRIFDRFIQLDTGTTKSHLGHGLGLSVVKALVELLNAQIKVQSQLGKGSTFTLILPLPDIAFISEDLSDESNEFLFDADESF